MSGVFIVRTDCLPETLHGWAEALSPAGVVAARGYAALDRDFKYMRVLCPKPKYFTVYDLAEINALRGRLPLEIGQAGGPGAPTDLGSRVTSPFLSGLYEGLFPAGQDYRPPHTAFMMAIGHDPPAEREDEYNAWYDTEHLPAMMRVPGFVTARRFVATDPGTSPKYIALYDLIAPSVIDSDSFLKERDSPWSAWVRTWFRRRLAYLGELIQTG